MILAFLLSNPWRTACIALALVLAVTYGVLRSQVAHYKGKAERIEAEYETFKAKTAALGEAAKVEAKRKETENADKLKKAGAAAADARTTLARWVQRYGSGGRVLPSDTGTPRGTDRTGQVCFDRAGLDGALQRFRGETAGLVGEGASAVIDRQECVAGWPR